MLIKSNTFKAKDFLGKMGLVSLSQIHKLSRILSGILSITQIQLKCRTNHKSINIAHLEYLISNNENGCSGSIPVGCRGRTRGHGCFAELSCQSPHTHHCSTQLRKAQPRKHCSLSNCPSFEHLLLSNVHLDICELQTSVSAVKKKKKKVNKAKHFYKVENFRSLFC